MILSDLLEENDNLRKENIELKLFIDSLTNNFDHSANNLNNVLNEIYNLSKYADEQVYKNPSEAAEIFRIINYKAKNNSKIKVKCSCVNGNQITINRNGCGETFCKYEELK